MTCGSCGKTISDKAIVCYRCGAPTAIPAGQQPAPRRAAAPIALIVIATVLVAVAVILPATSEWTPFVAAAAGAAGLIGAVWLLRR
jgi:hypothetical protein